MIDDLAMKEEDFTLIVRAAAGGLDLNLEEGESQLDFFIRITARVDAWWAAIDTIDSNPAAPLEVHAMAVGCWRRQGETDEALWERMEKKRAARSLWPTETSPVDAGGPK